MIIRKTLLFLALALSVHGSETEQPEPFNCIREECPECNHHVSIKTEGLLHEEFLIEWTPLGMSWTTTFYCEQCFQNQVTSSFGEPVDD